MYQLPLTDSQKIVLFELLNALEEKALLSDDAEQQIVSDIIAIMEPHMEKIFDPDYLLYVQEAKKKIIKK